MEKLKIYNEARVVPQEAKKPIKAGRLKGMTDISPMWRIKKLTELFGPCGVGWWYDIVDKQIVEDEITKQKAAFVDIKLYYVDETTGRESHGIPGTGGASFVAKENSGPHLSDECFKMALTDAISVAAKALGIGADVYWDKDSKYGTLPEADLPLVCADCGGEIKRGKNPDGSIWPAAEIAAATYQAFGRPLCIKCAAAAEQGP